MGDLDLVDDLLLFLFAASRACVAESIVACLLPRLRSLLVSGASGVGVRGGGGGGGGGGVSGGCGRGDLDLVLEVLIFEALSPLTRVLIGVLLGELLRRPRPRPRVLIVWLLCLSRALVF